ncbi:MAG: ChbG/HpnK family deacetylase [Gemmatimonadota bacterium]|nr:ChbG/HpnK family deacetylase [Gemmatimonadota bacterium]
MTNRQLIINADDFGMSCGVNAGIVRTFLEGVVTSASLMVRRPAAREAASFARSHPGLGLGLHLDLGEWFRRGDEWVARYVVVPLDDAAAVRCEVEAQLGAFRAITGRAPTHLDAHQHVHREEPVRSAVESVGRRLGIPVRSFDPAIRYRGDFYGRDGDGNVRDDLISVSALLGLADDLAPGCTELGCHPGFDAETDPSYGRERAREVRTLTDRRVREGLRSRGIELIDFRALPDRAAGATTAGAVS